MVEVLGEGVREVVGEVTDERPSGGIGVAHIGERNVPVKPGFRYGQECDISGGQYIPGKFGAP